MIPLVDHSWQGQPWQWQLANGITSAAELGRLLGISLQDETSEFPMLVPHAFAARMEAGNPQDPLLKQVLPTPAERETVPGYVHDAVGDDAARRQTGLLQKYAGRVLVIVSGACAVNCRYCFRRHFPYGDFQPDSAAWDHIIETVSRDPTVREVILSGGDPLVLSDRRMAALMTRLNAIEQVDTIRLHTRLPVVIPDRVTDELLDVIASSPKQVVIVLHTNHANEIDERLTQACQQLRRAGAFLLNQSVLLAGINDDADALANLSRRLFAAGALPYYLHQLDPVAGAAHFDVGDARALQLVDEIRTQLPGYLVPALVREVEGAPSKVPLTPQALWYS